MTKESPPPVARWFYRHPVAAMAYLALVGTIYLLALPLLTAWRVRLEYWGEMQGGYAEFPILKIWKRSFKRLFEVD